MKDFVIVGRAPANVIFRIADEISANYIRDGVNGHLAFTTRYLECGFEVPVPGDMAVTIRTSAETIEEAVTWVTVARELASIIAIAANAAVEDLNPEIAYEVTPDVTERDFFQRFVPQDKGTYSSRTVPMDSAIALLETISHSEHRDRVLRAITQYNQALLHWALGNELLIVSHLWMGVEAIKKAVLRQYLATCGKTKEELAAEWGFHSNGYMKIDSFLDAEARRRLVFADDVMHHKLAREVSDAFEHGLANGGALFAKARDTLVPTAKYLRQAIFDVAGLPSEHRAELIAPPYDTPRGPRDFEQYFRAKLIGEGADLSASGFPHPMLEWKHQMKEVSLDKNSWVYSFKPDHTMTVRTADGIAMKDGTFEVWDAGKFTPESAGEKMAKKSEESNA